MTKKKEAYSEFSIDLSAFNENKIKIAVPTSDNITIFKGMLGQAEEFHIFESKASGEFILSEKRANQYSLTMQHMKTLDVYELIKDCDIFISSRIGKKGIDRLIKKGVTLIFRDGLIKDSINEINEKFNNRNIKR